jgi:hypothetical protein
MVHHHVAAAFCPLQRNAKFSFDRPAKQKTKVRINEQNTKQQLLQLQQQQQQQQQSSLIVPQSRRRGISWDLLSPGMAFRLDLESNGWSAHYPLLRLQHVVAPSLNVLAIERYQ